MENELKVALAQVAPIWLDKKATLEKAKLILTEASQNGAELVVFGEAF